MSNHFGGSGNLAAAPILKQIELDGESRPVAEMRIYFDRRTKQPDGTYDDDGGFWVSANLWGGRAESAAQLLPKGTRVFAQGRLRTQSWQDDQGVRTELKLDVDYLAVDLLGLAKLTGALSNTRESDAPL
jgi:single-strand DNA-binding protein